MRARPGLMYKAGEAPSNRAPGNGLSYIQLALTFEVPDPVTQATSVQVLRPSADRLMHER